MHVSTEIMFFSCEATCNPCSRANLCYLYAFQMRNSLHHLPYWGARVLFLSLVHAVCNAAGGEGIWDRDFGVPGGNGPVTALNTVGQRTFVGGYFSQIGGVAVTNIAEWDGIRWIGLGEGIGYYAGGFVDSGVNSITTIGTKMYAAGDFTNAGSVPVNNIAVWDATNWHALGDGLNNLVFDLATDGTNLYAGGHFSVAGAISASRIAKWNGTTWSPLSSGVTKNMGLPFVHAIAISGGNVFVGGSFDHAGGMPATNVARWDGTNWFPLGTGLGPDPVYALAIKGNTLYAGGGFTKAGVISVRNIAQWNGATWAAVGGGVTAAHGSPAIRAILVNGSDVYVGGDIRAVGAVSVTNIARWDGSSWSDLGGGLSRGPNSSSVEALSSTGSEIFAAGFFELAGATPSTNIAVWHVPHSLSTTRSGEILTLSWPATGSNFVLEAKENVSQTNWSVVPATPVLAGDELRVTNQINSPSRLFRLRRK